MIKNSNCHKHYNKGDNDQADGDLHESRHHLLHASRQHHHDNQSLGRLPELSKLDLQTLQYNLTSVDGKSVPQFLQT